MINMELLNKSHDQMVVDHFGADALVPISKALKGFSEAFPAVQTATGTVRSADGEYTERVDFPKGEPENPMNEDEFKERYDGLMGYAGVGKEISDRIYSIIQSDDADVSQLVSEL